MLKVGINPLAYDIAYALEDMEDIPYIVVCDSHKWAYTFTVQRLQETGNKQVNLFNIDFHSDCRNNIKTLDCGNWLSLLMNEYRGKWRWLGWKDSYKVDKPRKLWSLPHLDEVFTDVFQPVVDGRNGQVQKGIWDSRYDRLHNDIEGLKIALDDWKRGMQKK